MPTVRVQNSRIAGAQRPQNLPPDLSGAAGRVASQALQGMSRSLGEINDSLERTRARHVQQERKALLEEAGNFIDAKVDTLMTDLRNTNPLHLGSEDDFRTIESRFIEQWDKGVTESIQDLPEDMRANVERQREGMREQARSEFYKVATPLRIKGTQVRQGLNYGEMLERGVRQNDPEVLWGLHQNADDLLSSHPEQDRKALKNRALWESAKSVVKRLEDSDDPALLSIQQMILTTGSDKTPVEKQKTLAEQGRAFLRALEDTLPEEIRSVFGLGKGTKVEQPEGGMETPKLDAFSKILEELTPDQRQELEEQAQRGFDSKLSDTRAEVDLWFAENPDATQQQVFEYLDKTSGVQNYIGGSSSGARGEYGRWRVALGNAARRRDDVRRAGLQARASGGAGTPKYERMLLDKYGPKIAEGIAGGAQSEEFQAALALSQAMITENAGKFPKSLGSMLGTFTTIGVGSARGIHRQYEFVTELRRKGLLKLEDMELEPRSLRLFQQLDARRGVEGMTVSQVAETMQAMGQQTEDQRENLSKDFDRVVTMQVDEDNDLFVNGPLFTDIPVAGGTLTITNDPKNSAIRGRFERMARALYIDNGGLLPAARAEAAQRLQIGSFDGDITERSPSVMYSDIPERNLIADLDNTLRDLRIQSVDTANFLEGEELKRSEVDRVAFTLPNGKVGYRLFHKDQGRVLVTPEGTTAQWIPKNAVPRGLAGWQASVYDELYKAANRDLRNLRSDGIRVDPGLSGEALKVPVPAVATGVLGFFKDALSDDGTLSIVNPMQEFVDSEYATGKYATVDQLKQRAEKYKTIRDKLRAYSSGEVNSVLTDELFMDLFGDRAEQLNNSYAPSRIADVLESF